MKKILALIAIAFCIGIGTTAATAQAQYSFEGSVPTSVKVRGRGETALTTDRYKDGNSSLKFSWMGQAELMIVDPAAVSASMSKNNTGVMMWICNEKPMASPLKISVKDGAGKEICWFDFNMDFIGWRAAWIKYDNMHTADGYFGDTGFQSRRKDGAYLAVKPSATVISGSICIDRLSFSTEPINPQVTPDQQIPDNNHFLERRNLWHWARLWGWEQNPELKPVQMTSDQEKSLDLMEKHLDNFYYDQMPGNGDYDPVKYRTKLEPLFNKMNLSRLPDGTVKGTPIVSNDESTSSDEKMQDAFEVMYRYALDYHITGDKTALDRFFLVGDNIIWQGIAFGSGMGTNHHYGYNIRGWNNSLWLLRDAINKAGKMKDYLSALQYWSGLSECRAPYEKGRDEIIDSWNTLLLPKVTAAMLQSDKGLRYAYMAALANWMDASMQFTQGTIGGIKIDGTAFHHGGHYPAYATGAFSTLGSYFSLVLDTSFAPESEARISVKKGLMGMRTYCNLLDWGIGISGRHPFGGAIPQKVVDAFGYLSLFGDLSSSGLSYDPELAGAYLALGGKNKDINPRLKKEGAKTSQAPQGFFVFNYGAFGIQRRGGWMVTLKGYNSDVWGSEIYTNDNRYGRYQSYGSVQVINSGSPASAKDSRFEEDGWDWNRLPGTTTIHLPYEMLNSPLPGTLMERNDSRFPGVSSLEGKNGVLAFTYIEKNRTNFCAGATATKSAFCFDNRVVFIGTGISNKSTYPTETTLFQEHLSSNNEAVIADNAMLNGFPQTWAQTSGGPAVVEDLKGNCYIVPNGGNLRIIRQEQTSPDDKMKKMGTGNFVSAILNHGTAPSEASYEYLMLVEPSSSAISKATKKLPYTVIQADNAAHVVKDTETGITGYVSYKGYSSTSTLVGQIPAETIVMERTKEDGTIVISICTPDLGITDKDYTTPQESQPLDRSVTLNGTYSLTSNYSDETFGTDVKVSANGSKTVLKATCKNGHPVEFILKKK